MIHAISNSKNKFGIGIQRPFVRQSNLPTSPVCVKSITSFSDINSSYLFVTLGIITLPLCVYSKLAHKEAGSKTPQDKNINLINPLVFEVPFS